MTAWLPILLAGLALAAGQWDRQMELHRLDEADYPLAKCNDGTQVAYRHEPGRHSGKVVIYLEGGGACWSTETCAERCDPASPEAELCTADYDLKKPGLVRQEADPYADHWMVYVWYCSSDEWAGTKSPSAETGGLYFHGRYIVEAVIADLTANHGLLEAESVVLTGCSAGAIGVVHNCDWLGEQLAGSVADYRCVADAPDLYSPDPDIAPGCFARDPEFQNEATEFWGRQLDRSCLEAAESSGETNLGEACGVTARELPHISSPLLVMSDHFDHAIMEVFGCEEMWGEDGDPEYEDFRLRWTIGHAAAVSDLTAARPDIALYAPYCELHCMTYYAAGLAVTEQESGQQVGVADFISGWLAGDGRAEHHAVDDITLVNPTCPE